MLVECSHCGAPLDVREGRASFVKCRYCGRTNQLQSLRTFAPQTPPGWRPPPVWTPPVHMPAGPAPLRYHRTVHTAVILGAIAALLVVMGAVAAVASSVSRGAAGARPRLAGGVPVARLAPVTLRENPERLAALIGVPAGSGPLLRVPLSGSRFDALTFEWDPGRRDHVRSFYLNLTGTDPQDRTLRERLAAHLGRRFNGEQFHWEGASLYFGPGSGILSVSITIERAIYGENPLWREQSEALWAVVRAAALGVPGNVDPALVRDWLGGGYPLRQIASLDIDTDVDASDAAVRKLFRGAVRELHIDLSYTIALDHPLFSHAELSWANKKASQLKELRIRPPPGQQQFGDQQALVACVAGAFGKPDRETEGDHLRGGGKDFTWRPKGGGEVRVYEHMIAVWIRDNPFAGAMPKDRWAKVVQTLDTCGRPAR